MKLNITALIFAYVAAAFAMQLIAGRTIIRRPVNLVIPVPVVRRVSQPNYGERYAVGINGGTFGGYLKENLKFGNTNLRSLQRNEEKLYLN
ncbi:hypothetical protein JTE90_022167 [Oedothorax gibbosus]|uniref:Uncharacterized protein n=1 Tax=Oedothorax gibbosus TaxID=931172 RepID=A0AAV6VRU0_9ARAC|nr:hypothetical protein JTE90_022167 [Oedothorax gibbosus]